MRGLCLSTKHEEQGERVCRGLPLLGTGTLIIRQLRRVQVEVRALEVHELAVAAAFDDVAVIDVEDAVTVLDR